MTEPRTEIIAGRVTSLTPQMRTDPTAPPLWKATVEARSLDWGVIATAEFYTEEYLDPATPVTVTLNIGARP